MSELLRMEHISKRFGDFYANKDISLTVNRGEVLTLLGENGAGKSTLMNILFGMPVIHDTGGFEGTVEIDGEDAHIMTPHDAMEKGIGMVHQEFMLIPGFTITENIKLNREITKPTVLSKIFGKRLQELEMDKMNADARKALDTMGMDIEEYTMVHGLPVGHMQFVEIAREIDKTGIRYLVFDEPTAVLTETETANLLAAIRRLAAQGIGIVFISHRLEEIISLSDRVTILRDGELVTTKDTKDITAAEIARLMVGRALVLDRNESGRKVSDEVILDVEHLRINMPGEKVQDVSFKVHKGEIVGIGGLAGQGKLGIANGIMGLYPADGKVVFKGRELSLNDTRDALKSDIAFVSEDRKGVGLLLNSPIDLNIAFTAMETEGKFLKKYGPIKLADKKGIRAHADKMIKDLDIRCTSAAQNTGALSGGNQQKVVFAKALLTEPSIWLCDEPTQAVDVATRQEIHRLLKEEAKKGKAVLYVSSDLTELLEVADEVAVMAYGKVRKTFENKDLKPTDVLACCYEAEREENDR